MECWGDFGRRNGCTGRTEAVFLFCLLLSELLEFVGHVTFIVALVEWEYSCLGLKWKLYRHIFIINLVFFPPVVVTL